MSYKNQQGGDKLYITNENIKLINQLSNNNTDSDIEMCLNPIYGLYMCESGYIINNYYLYDILFKTKNNINKDNNELISRAIKKISKIEGTSIVRPTDKISNISSLDIGRYLALMYLYKKYNENINNKKKDKNDKKNKNDEKINNNEEKIKCKKMLTNYLNFSNKDKEKIIKNYIKNNYMCDNYIYFHIILYILWWKLDDIEKLNDYYNGIDDIFKIYNKFNINYNRFINDNIVNTFENILISKIPSFKVYNQEISKYIDKENNINISYPDCGETTVRNLINLLCFDGSDFDIKILNNLEPIKQLIEYYERYNNFKIQSSPSTIRMFDGDNLNARDAWSRLIIRYANKDLIFNKNLIYDKVENNISYDLKSGKSNNNRSNFEQLISNLLKKFNNWDDLKINNIKNINVNLDTNFIGDITIDHDRYNKVIINLMNKHYYMDIKLINNNNNLIELDEKHKNMINIISNNYNEINNDNYLFFNYTSDNLPNILKNYNNIKKDIKYKLLLLSTTDKYDSDLRSRIEIHLDKNIDKNIDENFIEYMINVENQSFIYDYTYKIENFDINNTNVNNLKIKLMSDLNKFKYIIYNDISEINLSPLSNVKKIGNQFLYNCKNLTKIDLSPLSKIEEIGYYFLSSCSHLTTIDLSPLSNVKKIGYHFLSSCSNLTTIDLSPLKDLEEIGNHFLSFCSNLTTINLISLNKIKKISHDFLSSCSNLTTIDLSPLGDLEEIGNSFLLNCSNLKNINLSSCIKLKNIGNDFLQSSICNELILNKLNNLESIGNHFLFQNNNLTKIDLSGFTNLKNIGNYFLGKCENLEDINLSNCTNLESIGNKFCFYCINLKNLNLSGCLKLNEIGDDFLENCIRLKNLNLSGCSKLNENGDDFLENCSKNIKQKILNNQINLKK